MTTIPSFAADFGYQGTHILTHGALEDLAKAFKKKYGISISVRGGGCADGVAVVINDRYEMGGLCCPLKPVEIKKHKLIQHKVAVDIKAVIVNPRNPANNLTLKQVSGIHRGAITNWKKVGGSDRPIAVIYRDHCRDREEPVRNALGIKGTVAKKTIVVKTDQEIVEYVEGLSSAIGVVSRIFAEKANVKIIDVDGISPTPENTGKGLYRLSGDMYIVTRELPSERTRKFIEFVLSDEGQSIIGRRFARVK